MTALIRRCGIELSALQLDRLWIYHQLLRQHNADLNLTRIHNFAKMVLKLYVDAMLPTRMLSLPTPLMDLGSGAGMPGIPIKIVKPDLEIFLAESRRNRVEFLEKAIETLAVEGLSIIGRKITPGFQAPMAGVITRALEPIASTLERVEGCLMSGGRVIFMKGPGCDSEIEDADRRFTGRYRLIRNDAYCIPGTRHLRRLVVFQRIDEPLHFRRAGAMKRHTVRTITSTQNSLFKELKRLLGGKGVRKSQKALIFGPRPVAEALDRHPTRCIAWISIGDQIPPPASAPEALQWFQLPQALFEMIDVFGTHSPGLLVHTPPIKEWNPSEGFAKGCSLLLSFQDPENIGAVIRAAVAFGVNHVILLAESAHPFHPKAIRASAGAVFHARFMQGPSLYQLSLDLPIVPLCARGPELSPDIFPPAFGLLPGMEGPGLPACWEEKAVSIPIRPEVESLNAAAATAIALYVWAGSQGKK